MAYQNSLFEALKKMTEEQKNLFIEHVCLVWDKQDYSEKEFKDKFSEAVNTYISFKN